MIQSPHEIAILVLIDDPDRRLQAIRDNTIPKRFTINGHSDSNRRPFSYPNRDFHSLADTDNPGTDLSLHH
jgi:hypothetical protein